MPRRTDKRNFVSYKDALKSVVDELLKHFEVSPAEGPHGKAWCRREAQLALGNAARNGQLTVWGHKVIQHDERGSPVEFEPEPTEIPQVSWVALEIKTGDGDAGATFEHGSTCYVCLIFDQHELESLRLKWPNFLDEATRGNRVQSHAQHTVRGETECRRWLTEQMQQGLPDKPKSAYRGEALQRFPTSRRAFDRAWADSIATTGNTGWSRPGRKSRRRIKSPI